MDLSLLKKVNVSLTPSEGVLGDLPRRIIIFFFFLEVKAGFTGGFTSFQMTL